MTHGHRQQGDCGSGGSVGRGEQWRKIGTTITEQQLEKKISFIKKMNAKRPTLRHIIIKMSKCKGKERILKAAREKNLVTYGEFP